MFKAWKFRNWLLKLRIRFLQIQRFHNSVYCSGRKNCFQFSFEILVLISASKSLFLLQFQDPCCHVFVEKPVSCTCQKACFYFNFGCLFHVCFRRHFSISISGCLFPYLRRKVCLKSYTIAITCKHYFKKLREENAYSN